MIEAREMGGNRRTLFCEITGSRLLVEAATTDMTEALKPYTATHVGLLGIWAAQRDILLVRSNRSKWAETRGDWLQA